MTRLTLASFMALFVFGSCDSEDLATPGLLVPLTVDQDQTLPSLAINGTLLHLETHGDSFDPLVIIIHGGPGGDYRSMLSARQLANDGYYVIFYDQRGSGLSQRHDKNFYETGFEFYFDDLNSIIDQFRIEIDQKVFLVGHSWGAMLASGFVNQYPEKIEGVVLAEPGGLTWGQTEDYLSRSNEIDVFSEALNDALFTDQIFAGRSEHEILDYKSSYFASFENAPGNTIGNPGSYPFWRDGAVAFDGAIDYAEDQGFDFQNDLNQFTTEILFLYSEYNTAYGMSWAQKVSAPYPNADIQLVKDTGHEMFYFGWDDMYPRILNYLNNLR